MAPSAHRKRPRFVLRTSRPSEKLRTVLPFRVTASTSTGADHVVIVSGSWLALWAFSSRGPRLVHRQNINMQLLAACTVPLRRRSSGAPHSQSAEARCSDPPLKKGDVLLCLDRRLVLHALWFCARNPTDTTGSAFEVGFFQRFASRSLYTECNELAEAIERELPTTFQLRYAESLDRLLLNIGHHMFFGFEGIRCWLAENEPLALAGPNWELVAPPVPLSKTESCDAPLVPLAWMAYPAPGFVHDVCSLAVPYRPDECTECGTVTITIGISSIERELRSAAWRAPEDHAPSILLSIFVDDVRCAQGADQDALLTRLEASDHGAILKDEEILPKSGDKEALIQDDEEPASMHDSHGGLQLRYDARTMCFRAALPSAYVLGIESHPFHPDPTAIDFSNSNASDFDSRDRLVYVVTDRYVLPLRFQKRSLRPQFGPLQGPRTMSNDEQTTAMHSFLAYCAVSQPETGDFKLLLARQDGTLVQCDLGVVRSVRLQSGDPVSLPRDARDAAGLVAFGEGPHVNILCWDFFGQMDWLHLPDAWASGVLAPASRLFCPGPQALGLVHAAHRCLRAGGTPPSGGGPSSSTAACARREPWPSREAPLQKRCSHHASFCMLHQSSDGVHLSSLDCGDYATLQLESDPNLLTGSSRVFWLQGGRYLLICDRVFNKEDDLGAPVVLRIDEAQRTAQDVSDSWPLSIDIIACFYESVIVARDCVARIAVPHAVHGTHGACSALRAFVTSRWQAPGKITHADASPAGVAEAVLALTCVMETATCPLLIVLDAASLTERCRCDLFDRSEVTALATIASDRRLQGVAVASSDGALYIFDYDEQTAAVKRRLRIMPHVATGDLDAAAVESVYSVRDGSALLVSLRSGWLVQLDRSTGHLYAKWHLSHQPLKLYRICGGQPAHPEDILVVGHELWRVFWDAHAALGRRAMRVRRVIFDPLAAWGVPSAILPSHRQYTGESLLEHGTRSDHLVSWMGESFVVSGDGRLQVVRWHFYHTTEEPWRLACLDELSAPLRQNDANSEDASSWFSFWWWWWRWRRQQQRQRLLHLRSYGPLPCKLPENPAAQEHRVAQRYASRNPPCIAGSFDLPSASRPLQEQQQMEEPPSTPAELDILAMTPIPSCEICMLGDTRMYLGVDASSTLAVYAPAAAAAAAAAAEGQLPFLVDPAWTGVCLERDGPHRWADITVRLLECDHAQTEARDKSGSTSLLQVVVTLGGDTLYQVGLVQYHAAETASATCRFVLRSLGVIQTGIEEVRRVRFLPNRMLLVANDAQVAFLEEVPCAQQQRRYRPGSEIPDELELHSRALDGAAGVRDTTIVDELCRWRHDGLTLELGGAVASVQVASAPLPFAEGDASQRTRMARCFPQCSVFLTTDSGAICQIVDWAAICPESSGGVADRSNEVWSALNQLQQELCERWPFVVNVQARSRASPERNAEVSASAPASSDDRLLLWDILQYWWVLLPGPYAFDSLRAEHVGALLKLELGLDLSN